MADLSDWIKSHKRRLIVAAIATIVIILFLAGLRWPPENMTRLGCWLTLAAVIILVGAGIVYSLKESESTGRENMPRWKRTFLMAYLLVFGAGLVLMLLSLTSLDFPETPVVPQEVALAMPTPTPTPTPVPGQPTPTPTPTPLPTPIVPIVQRVFPQATGGNPPTQYLTVYGKNFQQTSKVRFNRSDAMTEFQADNLLTSQLRAEDLVGRGSIVIEVANPDGAVSNAILVPIEKPRVPLNLLFFWRFWHPWITREVQLLLLVIFAGALGSYLHSTMSIAEFIGGRMLKVSWFWWYLTRPFLGMAMGLVFYAMLRGGFLVGTPADEKFVNPFGVVAIGTLVGMFTDKAARKLSEIFDIVFKTPAEARRGDKLTVANLAITDATLADAKADTDYQQQFTATGGAGSNKWSLVDSPTWLSIDDTGKLKGKPAVADVKDINKVTVTVVDKAGASASKSFNLKVAA